MQSSKPQPSTGWQDKSTFLTVQQFILQLKADSRTTVLKFLEEVKEQFINENGKQVLCTADQKSFEIFQVLLSFAVRAELRSAFLHVNTGTCIKADFKKATGDMHKMTKFVECYQSSQWQAQMANANSMLQMWLKFIDVVTVPYLFRSIIECPMYWSP